MGAATGLLVRCALSELFERTVAQAEWSFSLGGSVDCRLDEVAVREFLVDAVEHLLMATFLLVDFISKVNVVFMIFIHAIFVSSVKPRFCLFFTVLLLR